MKSRRIIFSVGILFATCVLASTFAAAQEPDLNKNTAAIHRSHLLISARRDFNTIRCQRPPSGEDWVAIILEKLEVERKGTDGKAEKEYAAWVTRDGWRKVSNDKWLILYSEEVGQERLKGAPPPLANW